MSPRDLGLAEDGPESGDDVGMQSPGRPEGEPRDGMQEQVEMRLSRKSSEYVLCIDRNYI